MTAPSLTSESGQSLAGYQFQNTPNGLPVSGSYTEDIIDPDSNGVFNFVAKQGSATLFKVYTKTNSPPKLVDLQLSPWMVEIEEQGGGSKYNVTPGRGTDRIPAASSSSMPTFGLLCIMIMMSCLIY